MERGRGNKLGGIGKGECEIEAVAQVEKIYGAKTSQ
jgi:hypothetical protein